MKRHAPLLVLLLAVAGVYANALNAPFTYDDKIEVIGNGAVRALTEPWHMVRYNPARSLLLLTYAVNWSLGQLEPIGYHLLSIAIHVLNTWLAFRLAARLMSAERALLAAALWGIHPMATEGVTYISGRSDALVSTFLLLGVGAWIDDARSPSARARGVALGALVAAGLTKELVLAGPFLYFAADWALVAGGRWKLVEPRRYALPALLLVALASARLWLLGWPNPEVPRALDVHLITQGEVWLRYAQLWLVPWGQSILHPVPARWSGAGVVGTALALVAVGTALRARGLWAFAMALWALPLAVSSLPVLKETMAEHRAYLAGLGLMLALVAAAPYRRWLWVAPLVLGAATVARNHTWRSEESLWSSAAERWPSSPDAWYALGDARRFSRNFAGAAEAYTRVVELEPDRVDGWVNLGIARAEARDLAGARTAWELALKLRPQHCAALNNLAGLRLRENDTAGAASGYEGTLRACPNDPIAHYNLGLIWLAARDQTRAISHFRGYLRNDPEGPYVEAAARSLRRLGVEP